jgi:hypothetical protein
VIITRVAVKVVPPARRSHLLVYSVLFLEGQAHERDVLETRTPSHQKIIQGYPRAFLAADKGNAA